MKTPSHHLMSMRLLALAIVAFCQIVLAADTTNAVPFATDKALLASVVKHLVEGIEKEISNCRRVAKPWKDPTAEGGDIVGFFQGQSLCKAVEDQFGKSGRHITEFYFQSNRLTLAVQTHIEYQRPLYFDEKTKDLEMATRTQKRCYFAQNQLVNVLNGDGKPLLLGSQNAQIRAEELLANARNIAAALCATNKPNGDEALPLDHKVQALLANPKCTADETFGNCMATQLWDDELNRIYAELRRKLDARSMNELQDAQRKWIVWRDAEFRVNDTLYGRQHGTMYQSFCEHHKMDIVRSRALELQHWLDLQEHYLADQKELESMRKGIDSN